MPSQGEVLSLYRHILKAAKHFPSIKVGLGGASEKLVVVGHIEPPGSALLKTKLQLDWPGSALLLQYGLQGRLRPWGC